MHQVSLNADVNQDIFNFEDQIRFSYNQHKAAVQQHQADNKILLCRQRVGVMGSASEIEDATLDEARVKIAEHEKFKSESWANYLIKEKELLTFFNSDDLRQRLYEKELALINAEYKKKLDLAGENEDQKQQAQQERGNKIEEAKQRFEFDRFNGSGSSKSSLVTVLPGLKFEFDTTTAVSLTVTNLYDGMNRKISEALGNRNGCVRAQGDYYEASQAAKARQDKINKAPFLKIQARYDNGIRQELKVERRKRNKQRWKIARYVGLGVLGMVGLGLLAAATVATLGLVHLSWIIPVVYFSVGGVVVAGSASGAIANEESRRSAIAKFFHKVGLSLRISQVSRQKKPTHVKPLSAVRDEAEEFVVVTPPPLPQEPPALISEDDRETVRSRVRAASNNSLTKVVMEPVERPRPRSAPPTVASTMSQRVFSPPIPDSSNDDEAASRFLADATW
jgi:hypothetical protein